MKTEQWEFLIKTVTGENKKLPAGLIIDSPMMPGYFSINTIDFFAQPETWFDAYCRIKKDFPDLLFIPDWWVEYGMAAEPSGFGVKIVFQKDSPPSIKPLIRDADDQEGLDALKIPDPEKDGLMPMILSFQRYVLPRVHEMGEEIKIVSARGPLTIASLVMGVSEFLVLLKTDPDEAHKLLKKTTALCKRWLDAQLENVKEAQGVMVLDDLSGFLGKEDYLEFAHPYLKEIFSAYPDKLRIFHNDTDNDVIFPYVSDMGAQIFNPTYKKPMATIRSSVGPDVTILGALSTLLMVDGTPETVRESALKQISEYSGANGGSLKRLILSLGGGAPMGAKKENILAMAQAVKGFEVH